MRISKFHQSMKKDGLVPQAKSGRNKGILRQWRESRRQAAKKRQAAELRREVERALLLDPSEVKPLSPDRNLAQALAEAPKSRRRR